MTKRKAKHCWHHCGFTYTSYPTQHDEKCCHCGRVRRIRGVIDVVPGHGPHVREEITRRVEEDVGPCEISP